jgi:hypothetical protein
VFRHERVGGLAVFAKCASGANLVETHEPRVARHVSRYYSRQPASDPCWLLLLDGLAALATSCPDDAYRQFGLRGASSTSGTLGLARRCPPALSNGAFPSPQVIGIAFALSRTARRARTEKISAEATNGELAST